MRNLFKIAGLLALTGFISSCNDKETTANYQVIHLPQEITTAQSQPFTLNGSVKIIYPEGNEKMQRNAQFLADYLKKATGRIMPLKQVLRAKVLFCLSWVWNQKTPKLIS